MTTLEAAVSAAPSSARIANDVTGARPQAVTFAAIAVAAVIIGAIVGAALAIVIPVLTADPVAEHARLLAFADQLRDAIVRDQLWAISHP